MRALLLCTDVYTRNYYITLSIHDALKADPRLTDVVLATHGDALRLFVERKCNLFVAVGGAGHQSDLLERICRMVDVSVLWTTEDPYELQTNITRSQAFDFVFTNDAGSLIDYGPRAIALPLAASERFHDYPLIGNDDKYEYDLFFVGTAWPNRVESLNRILKPFAGRLRTKIALPGNEFLPKPHLFNRNSYIDWRCSNGDFARLANSSRITLTLERDFSASTGGRAVATTPPPRLFEAALAGSYQIVLTRSLETQRFFQAGLELSICSSETETISAINAALEKPDERIATAERAQSRARREHLYKHRVETILDHVMQLHEPLPVITPAGRRRVLIVTHNLKGMRQGGGIEVYQEQLKQMSGNYEFFYLVPVMANDNNSFRLRTPEGNYINYSLSTPVSDDMLSDAGAEGVFQSVLLENNIDIVHFQHLIGFPLSLPMISSALGIPTLYTFHDYFLICRRFQLLNYEGRFCDIANHSISNCDVCLNATDNIPSGSQGRRRSFISFVLGFVDAFIANTTYSSDYHRKLYPEISPAKVHVLEMLAPGATRPRPSSISRHQMGIGHRVRDKLRVVIPGNFTQGKGGHQLIRILNALREDDVEFTILGFVDSPFGEIIKELRFDNVRMTGQYPASSVVARLTRYEVSLHLSIWPETYMITLSEAWLAGVVPIVSKLGAPGDRVLDGVDGIVVDPYDIGSVVDVLRRISSDRSTLSEMRITIDQKRIVSTLDHVAGLQRLYDNLAVARPVPHLPAEDRSAPIDHLTAEILGFRLNSPRWDRANNVWDAQPAEMEPLSSSDAYTELPSGPKYTRMDRVGDNGGNPGRIVLDSVKADGIEVEGRTISAEQSFSISGWAFKAGYGDLTASYLLCSGSDGTSRVFEATKMPRPDVVEVLQVSEALECGFSVRVDTGTLIGNSYRCDLIQVYGERSAIYEEVLTVERSNDLLGLRDVTVG
jgi:glycosyltransferase involved in cell wall biosynthesis